MTPTPSNKDIVQALFKPVEGSPDVWVCQCGLQRKKNKTGWTNLMSHVHNDHPDIVNLIPKLNDSQRDGILKHFKPKKSKNVFAWLQIIILGLRPYSTVEDHVLRRYVNLDPVCRNTIQKYVGKLVKIVEKSISQTLPSRFCIVFDGWSCVDTHYLGVFATFSGTNGTGFERVLLTFSPMGDETRLDAEEHKEFLTFTLSLYGKNWSNVVALVGDNCSVNKKVSRISNTPLVGCASHRFNLAVMDIVKEHQTLVDKVRSLMVVLRKLIAGAKLRAQTHLKPRLCCPTRWGSYLKMLQRYIELRPFLSDIDLVSVDNKMPSARENRKIEDVLKVLGDLNSVSLCLQKESTSLADVRALFDTVIDDFPELEIRLGKNAEIVGCKEFESAVVLIQQGRQGSLSCAQKATVSTLYEGAFDEASTVVSDDELSLADRALKRRKTMGNGYSKKYVDTGFIVPTSNMVEGFFSRAGYAFSDRRRSLLPSNFEAQMFLYANASHWSVDD
eukprot:IDg4916t1